jgi:hypothetical protein
VPTGDKLESGHRKNGGLMGPARSTNQRKPWWRVQEEVAFIFEKLFRPIEAHVLHDTRQRDVVGVLRQLDVGVIDEFSGERRVLALVEVQKRKARVGLEDLGSWIYKRDTLKANELVVVSEKGFTRPVLAHVQRLHGEKVRLGRLHEVETGLIEKIGSTCLGVTRVLELWWFASIFVQYADADEIGRVETNGLDVEAPIFGVESPMGLIRQGEAQRGNIPPGQMHALTVEIEGSLTYGGRPLKRVLITAEKQRRIWDPKTRFYAYEELHPTNMQRGIAIISTFRLDPSRNGKMTLVISPDDDNLAGGNARIMGQFEFT